MIVRLRPSPLGALGALPRSRGLPLPPDLLYCTVPVYVRRYSSTIPVDLCELGESEIARRVLAVAVWPVDRAVWTYVRVSY